MNKDKEKWNDFKKYLGDQRDKILTDFQAQIPLD